MNDVKKASVVRFWTNFTTWHRAFLMELAEKYKAYGVFPLIPIRELALCYEDRRDREVAAFAGMLLKDDDKEEQRVREFRLMLGDSPREWFDSRGFMSLTSGGRQDARTGGVTNWRICQLMNSAHEKSRYGISFAKMVNLSDAELWKKRLVRLVFGTSDGLGLGGWAVAPQALKCPDSDALRAFARLWLPELRNIEGGFTFDEAVRMYGLKRDVDFFYAYLGWEEMCRRNPKGCSRYMTQYRRRYDDGSLLGERYWTSATHGIIPKVEF